MRTACATLEEIFVKSNRLAMMWALPFCAGFVLFAPDLVEFVLGDDVGPGVDAAPGPRGRRGDPAAGLQLVLVLPRARQPAAAGGGVGRAGRRPSSGLAVPALFIWGFEGFVWGRIASAALVLVVRLVYVRG